MAGSVRARIREMQVEIRDNPLEAKRGAVLLTTLTALWGDVLAEVRAAEGEYRTVLLEALATDEAANRAKIRAQGTPQYARVREAKDTERLCLELIRSLKKFLTLQAEEMRLSK